MKEIYKKIKGYDFYEVSNFGNIKSLKRNKEITLKPAISGNGYLAVNLYLNSSQQTRTIHQLVAEAFLGFKRSKNVLVVNHKDFNKLNNKLENLEIVTQRENLNKKHFKSTSKYTGVSLNKISNKWLSQISINGKQKILGYFETEIEAHIYYENALIALKNGLKIIVKENNFTSKHKGVFFDKNKKKWTSKITINKRQIFLGSFITENEALNAYKKALDEFK